MGVTETSENNACLKSVHCPDGWVILGSLQEYIALVSSEVLSNKKS